MKLQAELFNDSRMNNLIAHKTHQLQEEIEY